MCVCACACVLRVHGDRAAVFAVYDSLIRVCPCSVFGVEIKDGIVCCYLLPVRFCGVFPCCACSDLRAVHVVSMVASFFFPELGVQVTERTPPRI